jgi:aryl-alcohol dehydrogenase-like predicted oxidoreductase
MARHLFETDSAPVLEANGISAIPFFGLARGFLSGKYRPGVTVDSVRAAGVKDFQNDRGWRVLAVLDQIANEHGASVAAVSLAWLRSKKTVSVPIASARTLEQLREIMEFVTLSPEEVELIDSVS